MQVLILVSGYPSDENLYNCTWAHARSLGYLENGIQPIIINFGARKSYKFDGISVYCEKDWKLVDTSNIDIVLSHSPNMRKHFPFLRKNVNKFKKIFLFCHGSESMYINNDYPKPFSYIKQSFLKNIIRNFYDFLKMKNFKNFFLRNSKAEIIFVSNWMKDIFEKNIISLDGYKQRYYIINNTIHPVFFERKYSRNNTLADFITIRRFDDSKYGVDLVVKMAFANPNYKFHLYGKGNYFLHNPKPENLEIFNNFIKPEDMPELLNKYNMGLMPTRCDAQGVMMCEMAVYGIPLVTTDISVTREMLEKFDNVMLIKEELFSQKIDLTSFQDKKIVNYNEFFSKNLTILKEVQLIKNSKESI